MRGIPGIFFWFYWITALAGLALGLFPLLSVQILAQGSFANERLGVATWGISQIVFLIFVAFMWRALPEKFARQP